MNASVAKVGLWRRVDQDLVNASPSSFVGEHRFPFAILNARDVIFVRRSRRVPVLQFLDSIAVWS